jgi:cytochrome c-type biogenesis protein CcmE
MTRKQRRGIVILSALLIAGVSTALVLSALSHKIVFFYTPSELQASKLKQDSRIRLGGLVEKGTVQQGMDAAVRFTVTDGKAVLPVVFAGILPDLFREGQGVVAEGRLENGVFQADNVLAKHDENYMPAEVADALKKQGHWQPDGARKQ